MGAGRPEQQIVDGAAGGGSGVVVEEVLIAAEDLGPGVDAGCQGILGGGGFALVPSGHPAQTGRFPGVQAVGLDSLVSGHKKERTAWRSARGERVLPIGG